MMMIVLVFYDMLNFSFCGIMCGLFLVVDFDGCLFLLVLFLLIGSFELGLGCDGLSLWEFFVVVVLF